MVLGVFWFGVMIVGLLLMGIDKWFVVEFLFFFVMFIMVGVFVYDFYKNCNVLLVDDVMIIGIGFVVLFIVGIFVVWGLFDFVFCYGFVLFVWW